MVRLFRLGIFLSALTSLLVPSMLPFVHAQDLNDFFNFNNPVEYDQQIQLGRSFKDPDSIDSCLKRKEFFFNEVHNIWVEGLVRCKKNSTGVLSKATFEGISSDPADEQACKGLRDGQILVHGVPSEDEARRWSERCAYLGTIGGAGPVGTSSTSSNFSLFFGGTNTGTSTGTGSTSGSSTFFNPTTSRTGSSSSTTPAVTSSQALTVTESQARDSLTNQGVDLSVLSPTQQASRIAAEQQRLQSQSSTNYSPVYSGPGVQVPDESLVASGISKEKSLIQLIVFYTNATLPYVSVISVFVFVAAGLFYILSFTNEELHTKAKTMMTYVVIGIVIIFSAYTVVNTLLSFSSAQ